MTYRLLDLCKMVLSKMPLKSRFRGGAEAATMAVQISTFALSEYSGQWRRETNLTNPVGPHTIS